MGPLDSHDESFFTAGQPFYLRKGPCCFEGSLFAPLWEDRDEKISYTEMVTR